VRAGASLNVESREQSRPLRRLYLVAAAVAFALSPTRGGAPILPVATAKIAKAPEIHLSVVAPHFQAMLFDPEFISGPAPLLPADRLSASRGAMEMTEAPAKAQAENVPPRSQAVAAIPTSAASFRAAEHDSSPIIRRPARENERSTATAIEESASLPPLFDAPRSLAPALGYAASEDGVLIANRGPASGPSNSYDRWTAVYDLARHTVYLPNGAKLEAHSGLGDRRDDPRHVSEQNRGATPPHVYELASLEHEQLFHGVRALRLNPVGGGSIYGRTGLLAHTYMLGPRGDSNGCVVFKDYNAFLQAYQTGQVKRLAVVARLD
jgi:hypothetical protein